MIKPGKSSNSLLKPALNRKTKRRRGYLAAGQSLVEAASGPGRRNDLSPKLKVVRKAVANLKTAKRRMRHSNPDQIKRLVRVIKVTGICAPIIIDDMGHVVDGHCIVEAARALGIPALPCVIVSHLDERELEFLRIALNRVGETGEWNLDELRPALIDLREEGFALTDTGFSIPEIDAIVLDDSPIIVLPEEEEQIHDCPSTLVSRSCDLWRLGEHLVLCADSTKRENYERLLSGASAQAVFTDPPWNIPIKGFVSSRHDDFVMGAGELSESCFVKLLADFCACCFEVMEKDAVMFACIDWRSYDLLVGTARKSGFQLINAAVWNKGNGGMGSLYRSAHELVPVFCKGTTPRVNNVQLGRHGRDRTNVWTYPGANRWGSSASEAAKHHPTPKPVEMVHDAIIDVTNLGDIVLDPFLGSGTTLLAAHNSGRAARCIELDPQYVDVSIARWQSDTGQRAILDESGECFDEVRDRRAGENGE